LEAGELEPAGEGVMLMLKVLKSLGKSIIAAEKGLIPAWN
jgi:hypothetical protein